MQAPIDWVRAYNDMRWLLTLERAAVALNLSVPLEQLLADLYGHKNHDDATRR